MDDNSVEKTNIKEELLKTGKLIYPIRGVSMLPMLRQNSDCVVIKKATYEDVKPMDVVLYYNPDRDVYILHRLLWKERDHGMNYAMILGDNCISLEKVPEDWIIGRLTSFFRGEKEVLITSREYQLYVSTWAKPWKMRVTALKVKNQVHRAGGKVKKMIRGNNGR